MEDLQKGLKLFVMFTDAPEVKDIIKPVSNAGFIDMEWFINNIGGLFDNGLVGQSFKNA